MHAARTAALILFASAFLNLFGMAANQYLSMAAEISVSLLITLALTDKTGFVEASIVSIVAALCRVLIRSALFQPSSRSPRKLDCTGHTVQV
jgi:hypothetical protein